MEDSIDLPTPVAAQIDGIPTWWCTSAATPIAAVVFRVGRSDETFVSGGLTHLVEHLALAGFHGESLPHNGRVEAGRTTMWAAGSLAELRDFLGRVVAYVSRLPTERLGLESRVLETEAAGRRPGPIEHLMFLRFGAGGHGLVAAQEFGLRWLDETAVRSWADDRFCRGNAAIWMTAAPPEGLDLGLRAGQRREPVEPLAIAPLPLPAFLASDFGGVAVGTVVDRSTAATAAFGIAETRLSRRLRSDRGLAYEISGTYVPLTATKAHATLYSDALEEHAPAVFEELWRVLHELADEGPTETELAQHVVSSQRAWGDPLAVAGLLDSHAVNELYGAPIRSPAELLDERRKLTPAATAAAMQAAMDEAILIAPSHIKRPDSLREYPMRSASVVSGRAFRPTRTNRGPWRRLIVGEEGISVVDADERPTTILYADCVGWSWSDGGPRSVWGRDGFFIEIDPHQWRNGQNAIQFADGKIAPERFIADESRRPSMTQPPLTRRARTSKAVLKSTPWSWSS